LSEAVTLALHTEVGISFEHHINNTLKQGTNF